MDNIYAIYPVKEFLFKYVLKNKSYLGDHKKSEWADLFVAISPDEGAYKRTRRYLLEIGMKYLCCMTKTRDYSLPNHVNTELTKIVGDDQSIKNRWSIIFDDMADTCGTVCGASQILVEKGSLGVIVVVSHGILSGPAIERINKSNAIKMVVCSDSLYMDQKAKLCPKIKVFSIAELMAEVIYRRVNNISVSSMFDHS